MIDIDLVLSKHFAGEATTEEEVLAHNFRDQNPEEYSALQSFWQKQNISHTEYDSAEGWDTVVSQSSKVRRLNPRYRLSRIAAVAAVFLLAITGTYLSVQSDTSTQMSEIFALQQNQEVALDDGTLVYLNKDAKLIFPDKFATNKREVSLEGEAFFDVAKDATRPFVIHTQHTDVEVLGTSFNVDTNQEATEVSVTTGKVKVQSIFNEKSVILLPEQSARANTQDVVSYQTEDINYLAWKTGEFHFEEMPLNLVVESLNKYYDNKVVLKDQSSNCHFTSTFKNTELKEIIEIIQLSCGMNLNQKNEIYELY